MDKKKKIGLITNLCIVGVLCSLGVAVFFADLSNVFISVGAPVKNGRGGEISLIIVVDGDAKPADVLSVASALRGEHDKPETKTPATFFVGGNWASFHPEIIKEIAKDFEIGNHAYNNKSLARMTEDKQMREIMDAHKIIYEITNAMQVDSAGEITESKPVSMKLFMPPNGDFNKKTLKCADKMQYRTVIWSRDARGKTSSEIFKNATTGITGGDFVRLDVTRFLTPEILRLVIKEYNKNFTITKISDNI